MAVEAIYLLLTSKVLSWEEIRKKMVDGSFVDKVLRINLNKIKPKIMKQFKESYIDQETWDLERLKKASQAMGPLGEFLEFVTTFQKQQSIFEKQKDTPESKQLMEL